MSVEAYVSSAIGVDRSTIAEGLGASAFIIANATAIQPGQVDVVFSAAMLQGEANQQQIPADLFNPAHYVITNQTTQEVVGVADVEVINSTTVRLYTSRMSAVSHQLKVTKVLDIFGNSLATGGDVFSFTGSPPVYEAAPTTLHTFQGALGGINTQQQQGISWLPDVLAPLLQNQNPAPGAVGVSRSTPIFLDIIDPGGGTGINEASVQITVDGATAWIGDAQQPGFTVNKSVIADGFRYEVIPDSDLPESNQIVIGVVASDSEAIPNVLDTTYSFNTFGTIPIIQAQDPAPGAINVQAGTLVQFEVVDAESGIDPASVIITVNGVTAYESQADQNLFSTTVTPISGGFAFSVDPPSPLPAGSQAIRVRALNAAEVQGELDTTYGFSVFADVNPPQISNIDPAAGAVDVQATKAISFSLSDDGQIDDGETTIFVRGLLVYNGATQEFANGWQASTKQANAGNGFDFVLVPDVAFQWQPGEFVEVAVNTKDTSGLPLQTTWVFQAGGIAFPFNLHRFIIKAIRDNDRRSPGLLEKIITLPDGLNDVWEQKISDRAEALTDLLDPETIPEDFLPWLKSIVGFTRDLSFQATEDELRKIIGSAVPYWQNKPAERALDFAIRMVTGNRFKIRNFFDFRIKTAEPSDITEATFVTELLEDFDPDVLDFPGVTPSGDLLRLDFIATVDNGTFTIQDLNPSTIFPSGNFTSKDQFSYLQITDFPFDPTLVGFYRIRELTPGSSIGQLVDPAPFQNLVGVQTASWRLWGANSDHITEVRLVDEPVGFAQVNRVLMRYLIDQIRPASERIDIVYVAFLDQFITPGDLGQWQLAGATLPSLPSPGGVVSLPAGSTMTPDKAFASSWGERSVFFKFSQKSLLGNTRLHPVYVDSNNSYIIQLEPAGQTVSLIKRASAVETLITTIQVGEMNLDSVDSIRVDVEHSFDGVFIRVKFDGDELFTHKDTTSPFLEGSIQVQSVSGSLELYLVEVLTLPVDIDRVGPQV